MTGADVGVRERLFHTLDPTTRSFEISGRQYLLTDTVGFIRKLPHQLVDAFSATLEEALGADLVLHVVDASVPEEEMHAMMAAVDDVLDEIGAGETPRLLALNKVDLLDEDRRRELSFRFPDAVQVSGATGYGLDELREAIEARFLATLRPMELLLPYEEGGSALRAARAGRRARARGHRRGRAHPRPRAGSRGAALRALRAERRRRRTGLTANLRRPFPLDLSSGAIASTPMMCAVRGGSVATNLPHARRLKEAPCRRTVPRATTLSARGF